MKVPLLICIAYWKGDQEEAKDLCRIIAGLQDSHAGHAAHVMLIHRQDCEMDDEMIEIVKAKFNVITHKSTSPLKGWPNGSNGMFGSTMIRVATEMVNKYDCVYWMEPDAIPITKNWYQILIKTWKERHPESIIVGCRSDCNGDGSGDHITGCALYHPNIARLMPKITKSDHIAWDYEHRGDIVKRGGPTHVIENWYKARKADPGILDREKVGVVIVHGYKDDSLRKLVKSKYRI